MKIKAYIHKEACCQYRGHAYSIRLRYYHYILQGTTYSSYKALIPGLGRYQDSKLKLPNHSYYTY